MNLEEDTEELKQELRAVALDVLEAAEYKLGGGDIDALTLAINKHDLTKDQLARVKLLAREFLHLVL
jgi:hypothetical protein